MFADDTTVYCIGVSAVLATTQLNKALHEVYTWCQNNQLTPHPGKSGVMLFNTRNPMGPLAPVLVGGSHLQWVLKTRLLDLTVDHKLTWIPHVLETKKTFGTKLDLLKRSRFLQTKVLREFYFKVLLPSVY